MYVRETESSSERRRMAYRRAGPLIGTAVAVLTVVVASASAAPAGHGLEPGQERLAAPGLEVDGRILRLGMERAEALDRLEVHPVDDLGGVYEGRYVLLQDGEEPARWALFSLDAAGGREEYLGDLVFDDGRLAGWRRVRVMPPGTDAATLAAGLVAAVDRLLPGSGAALPGRSLPLPEIVVGADTGSMLSIRFAGQVVRLTLGAPDDEGTRTVTLVEAAGTEAR